MYTVLEILNLSIYYLKKMKIQIPRSQAEELVGEALGIGRMGIYLEYDRPLSDAEVSLCRNWLTRRAKGEPIQYISGKTKFFHCEINLTRDVLIPRQETEILVDKIAAILDKIDLSNKTLWDLCCGSGCIAIALKKRFPQLKVLASDLSHSALTIAADNAKKNEVQIDFLEGDLLTPFEGMNADFIVCNPPYIAEKEYESLDPEVRHFEPKSALISGELGTEIYVRLAKDLPSKLNAGGLAWFEIGTGQGAAIKELFTDPKWMWSKVESDWAGHDRFFSLELE